MCVAAGFPPVDLREKIREVIAITSGLGGSAAVYRSGQKEIDKQLCHIPRP